MSAKDIIGLVIAGFLTFGTLAFLAVGSVAIYLECIRPHLAEMRRKARRVIGLRLVVDREPEVKSDDSYRRQSS